VDSIDDARLETWSPDFSSSGLADPTWTRVLWRDFVVCNSLEEVEWLAKPAQPVLCEECGFPECSTDGYAELSRLGGYLLWTSPRPGKGFGYSVYETLQALRNSRALSLSAEAWSQWRSRVDTLPAFDAFAATRGLELADAWLSTLPDPVQLRDLSELIPMLRRDLLLGDETPHMIERIERIVAWLEQHRDRPVEGRLVSAKDAGARIEPLFLDGVNSPWNGVASTPAGDALVLGTDSVFVREQSPQS
jgi:hypothetical protein